MTARRELFGNAIVAVRRHRRVHDARDPGGRSATRAGGWPGSPYSATPHDDVRRAAAVDVAERDARRHRRAAADAEVAGARRQPAGEFTTRPYHVPPDEIAVGVRSPGGMSMRVMSARVAPSYTYARPMSLKPPTSTPHAPINSSGTPSFAPIGFVHS